MCLQGSSYPWPHDAQADHVQSPLFKCLEVLLRKRRRRVEGIQLGVPGRALVYDIEAPEIALPSEEILQASVLGVDDEAGVIAGDSSGKPEEQDPSKGHSTSPGLKRHNLSLTITRRGRIAVIRRDGGERVRTFGLHPVNAFVLCLVPFRRGKMENGQHRISGPVKRTQPEDQQGRRRKRPKQFHQNGGEHDPKAPRRKHMEARKALPIWSHRTEIVEVSRPTASLSHCRVYGRLPTKTWFCMPYHYQNRR